MAEVPVTINGVICDLYGRTIMGPVKIVGSMVRTDRTIGGGPIEPPEGGGGGEPPSTWPPQRPPHPAHPIVLPTPPTEPPPTEPPTNPPSSNWEWGWNPNMGWAPVYIPGDKPQPIPPPAG